MSVLRWQTYRSHYLLTVLHKQRHKRANLKHWQLLSKKWHAPLTPRYLRIFFLSCTKIGQTSPDMLVLHQISRNAIYSFK